MCSAPSVLLLLLSALHPVFFSSPLLLLFPLFFVFVDSSAYWWQNFCSFVQVFLSHPCLLFPTKILCVLSFVSLFFGLQLRFRWHCVPLIESCL